MKTNHIALAALALAVAGCAGITPGPDRTAQVVPGVSTRADVEATLGKPVYSFAPSATKAAESTWSVHDSFGQDTAFTVEYSPKGVVQSTFAVREEDH